VYNLLSYGYYGCDRFGYKNYASARPRPPHITPFFWFANAPKKLLDPIPSSSRTDKVWGQVNGSGEVGGGGMEGMGERGEREE